LLAAELTLAAAQPALLRAQLCLLLAQLFLGSEEAPGGRDGRGVGDHEGAAAATEPEVVAVVAAAQGARGAGIVQIAAHGDVAAVDDGEPLAAMAVPEGAGVAVLVVVPHRDAVVVVVVAVAVVVAVVLVAVVALV